MKNGTQTLHGNRVTVTNTGGTEYIRGNWEITPTNPDDTAHKVELGHEQNKVILICSCGHKHTVWTKGY